MSAAESPTTEREHAELLARIKNMGTLEVLPIPSLHFDENYQRDLRSSFAQKLAANWSTTALGFPVVSRRAGGKLYVINGQHRIAAAQLLGLGDIVCLVISGLSEKEEADLRLHGNVHQAETSLETFKAKVAARYPDALDIVALCERFDTKVNKTPSKHGGLNTVSSLEYLYAQDRGATLARVFELIRDAWGVIDAEHGSANMLKSLAWMLTAHENDERFDRARLVERLQMVGPAALQMKMHTHRAALGGSQWVNMYRAIVEVYNERLSEANRLSWRTRGYTAAPGGWNGE